MEQDFQAKHVSQDTSNYFMKRGNIFSANFATRNNESERGLKTHISTVHEGNKPLQCELCEFKTSNIGVLNQHKSEVHEGKKAHQCDICKYKFARKWNLTKHVAAVHDKKKTFECEDCNLSFSRKQLLKRHVSSFHE